MPDSDSCQSTQTLFRLYVDLHDGRAQEQASVDIVNLAFSRLPLAADKVDADVGCCSRRFS